MSGNISLKEDIQQTIIEAAKANVLGISAISIWEISMLAHRQRITLHQPVKQWIDNALKAPGLSLLDLTSEVLYESTVLPGELHKDPGDRMIIATARIQNAVLLTRDENILRYANQGYLTTLKV